MSFAITRYGFAANAALIHTCRKLYRMRMTCCETEGMGRSLEALRPPPMYALQMAFEVVLAGERMPTVHFWTHIRLYPFRVVRVLVCLQVMLPCRFVTAVTTFVFPSDGTRAALCGRRSVVGGVLGNCGGRRALIGGGETVWRNADGW